MNVAGTFVCCEFCVDLQKYPLTNSISSAENIAHRYESGEYSIIKDNYLSEIDIFDTPNIFIAIVSNPDYDVPMIATAVNDTPTSIMSTVQRGRRIVRVDKINNLPDEGYDYLSQVTVAAIPYVESDNAAGGKTATIAG